MEPQVIASTYEVIREIGSGGGGVVYLARHNRLNKLVVLKADKRKLTTKEDVLRREVDALKNLNHTYIPQVYDFIAENNTVYTVMDYIEGESLDEPLKRGAHFSQPQVIEWACQLLEALCYLHGRPPHGILHSDIKPANIMLTPQNDIRLIDFNIALALGEEGAVRVGFSQGYASPEHYGAALSDAAPASESAGRGRSPSGAETSDSGIEGSSCFSDFTEADRTRSETESEMLTYGRTEIQGRYPDQPVSGGSASLPGESPGSPADSGPAGLSGHGGLLDVRSDIYSLGATLYHLLTGRRPAKDAREVEPITGTDGISPAVAAIIQKAMAPDPDLRYQTAAEMLYDLEHLHSNDPRTKSLNRWIRGSAASIAAMFLLGGVLLLAGFRQAAISSQKELNIETLKNSAANNASASLAAARQGDIPGALSLARDSLSDWETPDGIHALANASGVYNMDGGFYAVRTLPLDGKPLKLTLSPEGSRIAVLTSGTWNVFDTGTGDVLYTAAADISALSEAVFRDEHTLYYAGSEGVVCYDLGGGAVRWTGEKATTVVLSADRTTLATIYRDAHSAAIYDAKSGERLQTVDFGEKKQTVLPSDNYADPGDNLCAISAGGDFLAVSFSDGSLTVYDLNTGDAAALLDASNYVRFEGGFSGAYFAYSAASPRNNDFLYEIYRITDGWENQINDISDLLRFQDVSTAAFHCFSDETGIFYSNGLAVWNVDMDTRSVPLVLESRTNIQSFEVAEKYVSVLDSDGVCRLYDREQHVVGEYRGNETGGPIERFEYAVLAGKVLALGDADPNSIRILREDIRPETICFTYAPDTLHMEARVSRENSTLVLFTAEQFQIFDQNGQQLAVMVFPRAEDIFDVYFARDLGGDSLEVLYYDGTLRRYSASDGTLLKETNTDPPDKGAAKERVADHWKVLVPPQGKPKVYDLDSGESLSLGALDEMEGTLTYLTQVGNHVVVEYFTKGNEKFGALLLDEDRQVVAELPWLTDVFPDGTVYFDNRRGQIRETHVYSLPELLELTNREP